MSIGFRLASCALATVLGCLLAGCETQSWLGEGASTEKTDRDRLMRVASDVEAQGEIAAALPIYERAAATSSDATAQLRLGDAYTRAGKTDQAIQAYRAALAAAPDNPDALLGLGSALVKAGDPDGAVVALAKVAPIVNTMTAYNRLGVAQTPRANSRKRTTHSTLRAHSPLTTSMSAPISPSPLRSTGRKPRR